MKRDEANKAYTWKLCDIFESDEKWEQSMKSVSERLNLFDEYKGKLNSEETLLSCLSLKDELSEICDRIYVYAHMQMHEDMGNSRSKGFADQSEALEVSLSAKFSFIEPELLSLDEGFIKGLLKDKLKTYEHYFNDLFRQKAHILPQEQEELLANAREVASGAENIFAMFNNADIKFGTIKNEKGEDVELTHAKFRAFMENTDRNVRKNAYETYYATYLKHRNTLAATYAASVKSDIFFAKSRKYSSSLEAALGENNIPTHIYKNLIDTIGEYLPLMHKYVEIRKKRLGLTDMKMYDLYVPIVPETNANINYEDAKKEVLKGLAPMGEEYCTALGKGFDSGWVDVYENEGKRSGAYSWGAYGTHPYVLMNYDNKLDDCFTLAHEMGHAMHSYYSWKTQPYLYGGHTIFLAEVASTTNEALLMDYMLKKTPDKAGREYLVNQFLEQFKGTMFRQTMFAEFEMLTHQMAENGKPLTVDSLCELYSGLNKKYYGNNIETDERIAMEWARIPHFYSAFYVYQYATGFAASMALSQKILNESGAVDAYIEFLKSGCSDYSVNILKKAGVDMSQKEPIVSSLKFFEKLLETFTEN